MKDTAIVILRTKKNGVLQERDIEIPLDITANDLVVALNAAYQLGIDIDDYRNCFLRCERPIVLLRGERNLKSFGIRNGSLIHGND